MSTPEEPAASTEPAPPAAGRATRAPRAPRALLGSDVRVVNLAPVALTILACVVAVMILPSLLTVLISMLIAVVLAIAVNPLVARLARVMPRGAAAGLVLLAVVALVVGVGAMTIPSILAQVADLVSRVPSDVASLRSRFVGLLEDYPQLSTVVNGDLGSSVSSELPRLVRTAAGGLPSVSWTTVTFALNTLVTALTVLFLAANPGPLLSGLSAPGSRGTPRGHGRRRRGDVR